MNRGYIKLWRKSKESSIFAHEGLWKLFCLCLMKAAYKEVEITISGLLKPVKLSPGQFIAGRDSLHFDYHQGDKRKKYSRKAAPTAITLYRWLLNLENMQILNINSCNKFSIITVVNWPQYQGDEQQKPLRTPENSKDGHSFNGKSTTSAKSEHLKKDKCIDISDSFNDTGLENEQQMNNRRTTDEHKEEVIKKEKETPFSSLKNKYDSILVDNVFRAIASTRKSGKVADSILLAQLRKWDRYPVEQVKTGIRVYLEKDYAGQGKREEYLLGIIRNQKPDEHETAQHPQQREITMDNIGELYEN